MWPSKIFGSPKIKLNLVTKKKEKVNHCQKKKNWGETKLCVSPLQASRFRLQACKFFTVFKLLYNRSSSFLSIFKISHHFKLKGWQRVLRGSVLYFSSILSWSFQVSYSICIPLWFSFVVSHLVFFPFELYWIN
jgi:hypothetical protein